MKKTTIAIFSVMVMLMMAACNGGSYKRTKSGLMYKIISEGNSPKTKKGQVIKFTYVQKIRDSVLISSDDNGYGYVVVDSAVVADYNPNEIFPLLRKGDSAVVIYEADTIRKKNGQLPPFLKAKDKIFLMVKVLEVFNSEQDADKDRLLSQAEVQKKMEAKNEVQKQKELSVLREYLKSKGITVQSAPKGTLVEVTNPGDGPAVDSGKFVSVMYTGQTMAGVVFDSSIDPKFQHPGQPYTFQIGSMPPGAIEGWNDGLRLFKKGGKGRLYIPSALGYGKRGNGELIKPDENLIFDVEIVNVTDTMPARPAPGGAPNE